MKAVDECKVTQFYLGSNFYQGHLQSFQSLVSNISTHLNHDASADRRFPCTAQLFFLAVCCSAAVRLADRLMMVHHKLQRWSFLVLTYPSTVGLHIVAHVLVESSTEKTMLPVTAASMAKAHFVRNSFSSKSSGMKGSNLKANEVLVTSRQPLFWRYALKISYSWWLKQLLQHPGPLVHSPSKAELFGQSESTSDGRHTRLRLESYLGFFKLHIFTIIYIICKTIPGWWCKTWVTVLRKSIPFGKFDIIWLYLTNIQAA